MANKFGVGLVLSAALSCAGSALAQEPRIETLRTGIAHQALFGIDFRGEDGLAVGTAGSILLTRDGGNSWQPLQQDATRLSLFDVSLGERRTLACGQMGAILIGEREAAWRLVNAGTEMRLLAIDQGDSELAVAVGQFGTIVRSVDGGERWQSVAPDWSIFVSDGFEPQLYDVDVDAQGRITVVGEFGLVLRSHDAGETWRLVRRGVSPRGADEPAASLWGLALQDSGVGYAVGQEGLILKTEDGGETWRELESGTTANLQGVHADASGRVLVVGVRESLESTDHGASWRRLNGADVATGWYQALASSGPRQPALAVGHSGRIIRFVN